MKKFLVDVNLPRKIKVWQTNEFEFVAEINDEWTDSEIWEYAKARNLTIITKDADFSHRIIISRPPPKIIHIRIGNMRLKDFQSFIIKVWNIVEESSDNHKLVNVFTDRIEAVE
jgi:predicted nuclease of predicted toxin-antitoxin system